MSAGVCPRCAETVVADTSDISPAVYAAAMRNHDRYCGKPATVTPIHAHRTDQNPPRPHPRRLVDHEDRRVARAASKVLAALNALDHAWTVYQDRATQTARDERRRQVLAAYQGRTQPDPRLVRAWARNNDYPVADRGRVPAGIIAAYLEAVTQ